MSDFIKFFNKIEPLLDDEQKKDLEHYAYQYAKFWRVFFKILKVDENEIIIRVEQEKKPDNATYFTAKELNDKTRDLFSKYFNGFTLHINPVPYQNPKTEIVSAEWVKKQMQKYHIKSKILAEELGLSKSEISLYLSGGNPLGGRSKAMFYYYFKTKELESK